MGTMMKFWNAAIWSNFSAHSPAIRPSVPSRAAPMKPNARIHSGATSEGCANHQVTAITPMPTARPRTMDEPT